MSQERTRIVVWAVVILVAGFSLAVVATPRDTILEAAVSAAAQLREAIGVEIDPHQCALLSLPELSFAVVPMVESPNFATASADHPTYINALLVTDISAGVIADGVDLQVGVYVVRLASRSSADVVDIHGEIVGTVVIEEIGTNDIDEAAVMLMMTDLELNSPKRYVVKYLIQLPDGSFIKVKIVIRVPRGG